MKNRIIWLFIIIFIFWSIYWLYYYFFKLNKWTITINWNISDYNVNIYNNDLKINFKTVCAQSFCKLIDIAPFTYEMSIEKKWYKKFEKTIKVIKRNNINIDFSLEKELIIEKQEKVVLEEKTKVDNKITELRELWNVLKSYKYFNLQDLWYFYFSDNWNNTLSLYKKSFDEEKDALIVNTSKSTQRSLNIFKIYGQNTSIFIDTPENKYIYNTTASTLDSVFFPQNINYVKRNLWDYVFVNNKWSFLYNPVSWKVNYFYFFKDFISLDDNSYIWVIYSDEIDKKKNLWLNNYSKSIIVKYDFEDKKYKVLKEIDFVVSKIIRENDVIYLYDNDENKYLIDNIE